MGYYSDVVLAIAPEATTTFYALLSTDELIVNLVQGGSDSFDVSQFQKGDLLIQWYDVKWNDGFSEVAKLHKWMEAQAPENYRFLRVGEEKNDIEEHGDYAWDFLEISKPLIELNFPVEVK